MDIGSLIAALLTLMILSYIFGDNALFKLATHIFVGVAIGYAIIVIWYEIIIPAGQSRSVALLLCLLLLLRITPSQNPTINSLSSIPLALVLGVGAALAIGGAIFGTLLPQTAATATLSLNPDHYTEAETEVELILQWLNNIIIILGTLGTFFYFTFAVRAQGLLGGLREGFVQFWAGMGRLMIVFTLGALFANTVSARVALLVSRLTFLGDFITGLFGGG